MMKVNFQAMAALVLLFTANLAQADCYEFNVSKYSSSGIQKVSLEVSQVKGKDYDAIVTLTAKRTADRWVQTDYECEIKGKKRDVLDCSDRDGAGDFILKLTSAKPTLEFSYLLPVIGSKAGLVYKQGNEIDQEFELISEKPGDVHPEDASIFGEKCSS